MRYSCAGLVGWKQRSAIIVLIKQGLALPPSESTYIAWKQAIYRAPAGLQACSPGVCLSVIVCYLIQKRILSNGGASER